MRFSNYFRTLLVIYYKKFLNVLPLFKYQKYTPFIILCHARTGSTLLHTYLNSHTAIVSLGEQAGSYIKRTEGEIDEHYLNNYIFNSYSRAFKAVGLKFFYGYAIYPRGEVLLQELLKMPLLKVIVLKRENMLRAIISSQIADKTGYPTSWTQRRDFPTEDKRIFVDTGACIVQLKKMEEENKRFEKLFQNHHRLYLSYEELLSNKSGTLENIQRFLNVRPHTLFSLLRKQNPEPLRQLIINYKELENALRGTTWENMLEE